MRPDVSEALRYLGIPHPTGELRREAERMADELSDAIQPRYFYQMENVERLPDRVRLQKTELDLAGSTALGMLAGCDRAVLLACTLGARFDAKLLAIQARDMAKAVIYDALGSAFVEACAALDTGRRLGVTVTPSLLMNPVKSVTAVIGLSDAPQPARVRGCGACNLRETCQFRKEGKTCGA